MEFSIPYWKSICRKRFCALGKASGARSPGQGLPKVLCSRQRLCPSLEVPRGFSQLQAWLCSSGVQLPAGGPARGHIPGSSLPQLIKHLVLKRLASLGF